MTDNEYPVRFPSGPPPDPLRSPSYHCRSGCEGDAKGAQKGYGVLNNVK